MTPSALACAYTCSICRQTLTLKDPILIGEKPPERRNRVGQMMVEHLAQHHKNEIAQMFAVGEGFKGLLFSRAFSHNDTDLAQAQEISRQKFRQFTAPPGSIHITDEQIQATVEGRLQLRQHLAPHFPPDTIADLQNAIVGLMRQMRDALMDSKD